jgi:hypothetical protein
VGGSRLELLISGFMVRVHGGSPTPSRTWRRRFRPERPVATKLPRAGQAVSAEGVAARPRAAAGAPVLSFLRPARGFQLAVDDGHVPCVVAFASSRGEVVETLDLRGAQLDPVGSRVLLDAGDPLGARNRCDVVALREEPR